MRPLFFQAGDWIAREVQALNVAGRSQQQIADELHIPKSRVRILYRRLGLKTKPGQRTASLMIVAPAGHIVSRHFSERAAQAALYALRKSGCHIEPIVGV